MFDLTLRYKVEQADFKSLNNELKLNIHLGADTPNDVLPILIKNGLVTHFTENIPSINDIFISSVQGLTPNQF